MEYLTTPEKGRARLLRLRTALLAFIETPVEQREIEFDYVDAKRCGMALARRIPEFRGDGLTEDATGWPIFGRRQGTAAVAAFFALERCDASDLWAPVDISDLERRDPRAMVARIDKLLEQNDFVSSEA